MGQEDGDGPTDEVTRVLIVDDNSYNTFAIKSMLQQYSIDAETASDGVDAITKVRQMFNKEKRTYDLIIMDQFMPICDGTEATKGILKFLNDQNEPIGKPFICCLTSYIDKLSKIEAKEAGMNLISSKPIFKSGIIHLLSHARIFKSK